MLVDESISGWIPKTTKLGGLPTYTFKLMNSVPFGTMFQNGAECISEVLVVQVFVQNLEQQTRKTYHGDMSSLPDQPTITAHTAEVLCLVDGAMIPKRLGWL
jgi:hypothetical protein